MNEHDKIFRNNEQCLVNMKGENYYTVQSADKVITIESICMYYTLSGKKKKEVLSDILYHLAFFSPIKICPNHRALETGVAVGKKRSPFRILYHLPFFSYI